MRPLIALLVLGSMAGCSVKYDLSGADWTKPGGTTVQQITEDEMECVRGAREAGGTPDLILGGLLDVGRYVVEERQRSSSYRDCMEAKGYQPS
jgi:hypothetical protein